MKPLSRRLRNWLLLIALIAVGCGGYEGQVTRDFLKEHPNYKVLWVGGPDGNDTQYVTFHIRYRKPGDGREYWTDWSYLMEGKKIKFAAKGVEVVAKEEVKP